MATKIWKGGAPAVAQVDTLTPGGTIEVGDKFKITLTDEAGGSHTLTVSATGTTIAQVCADIAAAFNACTDERFTPITAADATTHVTLTADTPGRPFYCTAETTESNGDPADGQTFVRAAGTASSGPRDYNVAANWSGGEVPAAADAVIVPGWATDPILYGLDQSAVALLNFTAQRGGPAIGGREAYLHIDADDVLLDSGADTYLQADNVTGKLLVTHCGTSATAGSYPLNLKGAGIGELDFSPGSSACRAAVAGLAGETATVTTVRQTEGHLTLGPGLTCTTVEHAGGTLANAASPTTLKSTGPGTMTHTGGALTNLTIYDGTLRFHSAGTVTNLIVANAGRVDYAADPRPRTVTNADLYAGAAIADPHRTVSWTNGLDLNHCSQDDVDLNLGDNIRLTVGAAA